MPELPEVETIVRAQRARLQGRRISAFDSRWARNTTPSVAAVRRAILGRTITELTRRGKLIVFRLDDGGHLLVHLRMSGRFAWAGNSLDRPQHVRASWRLDDGSRLLLCDARKFGRISFTRDFAAATSDLGPEPLDAGFTAAALGEVLRRRRRQLKPLLLDQRAIAGLGNIYADEALFLAGLHPLARSHELSDEQVRRLHRSIRRVLREAIRRQGTTIDWIYPGGQMQDHLRVYGRGGRPCVRCGTPIAAFRVAQRGTHICPNCQPLNPRARTDSRNRGT